MKIAYFRCLCTSEQKRRAKELRAQGVEVRVVKRNPAWRTHIKQYNHSLPFMIDNDKVISL